MSHEIRSVSNEPAAHPYPPDASNVLVLASTISSTDDRVCTDLLTHGPSPEVATLHVDYTRSSANPLGDGSPPANRSVKRYKRISVGHQAGNEADHHPDNQASSIDVELAHINNAGNLTALGVEIAETLSEWDGLPGDIGFCFHSLTPLCQYAEVDRIYRFLHEMTGHLSQVGARAHYHMDPDAHDDRTIATVQTLFDAIVHVADDGTLETIAP